MRPIAIAVGVAIAISPVAGGCGGGDSTTAPASSTATESTASPATSDGETTEFLGATLTAATAGERGVAVVAVKPRSRSRLKVGDVIVAANGEPVATPEELVDAVGGVELGARYTIRVVRGSQRFTLTELVAPTAFLGTEVKDAQGSGGAKVVGIAPDGPAREAGIEPGDVIVAVDGEPVGRGDDLLAAIAAHSPGDEVTVTVSRDGARTDLSVTLVRNPGATG